MSIVCLGLRLSVMFKVFWMKSNSTLGKALGSSCFKGYQKEDDEHAANPKAYESFGNSELFTSKGACNLQYLRPSPSSITTCQTSQGVTNDPSSWSLLSQLDCRPCLLLDHCINVREHLSGEMIKWNVHKSSRLDCPTTAFGTQPLIDLIHCHAGKITLDATSTIVVNSPRLAIQAYYARYLKKNKNNRAFIGGNLTCVSRSDLSS